MDRESAWLALINLPSSTLTRRSLIEQLGRIGSPERLLRRGFTGRATGRGDPSGASQVTLSRLVNWRRVEETREALAETKTELIPYDSPGYPSVFRRLKRPPLVVFCRGRRELMGKAGLAVVGTRRATIAGERWTYETSRDLSRAGLAIISGLAEGIDAAAHRGALDERGETVAVLGCGPDVPYPRGNRDLMEEIALRGLLVSEHPPGSPPLRAHFPERNRLVSALARCVLVVEAGCRSGALITAEMARKQGRPVMAVPGGPSSPESAGTNRLIKRGEASLVENASDILRVLGWGEADDPGTAGFSPDALPAGDLLPLLSAGEGTPVDLMARRLGRPVNEVLSELLQLELEGRVEPVEGGGLWRRCG